ncbi:MAG: hypothetical protein J6A56_02070 [Clostridia bacterium]|nr:hypothetical protein [Clostridia bacterium]
MAVCFFKLTEPLMGVNDMKMMIRYALGEEMCSDDELHGVDVSSNRKIGAQLMVPLWEGTISSIEGLEELKKLPCLQDFIQYYEVGDTLLPKHIGTLGQHFGRFTLVAEEKKIIFDAVRRITNELVIRDENGNVMNTLHLDLERTK